MIIFYIFLVIDILKLQRRHSLIL